MGKKRLLILASSSSFAASIVSSLLREPDLEVAASVFTDRDAMKIISAGGADVLVCDSRITGLNVPMLVQQVKASKPAFPIVLLVTATDPMTVKYRALVSGLVKLPMTVLQSQQAAFMRELLSQIKGQSAPSSTMSQLRYQWRPGLPFASRFSGVVAIGASAGGTEATEQLLRKLPGNMPGMVITQHMPPVFTRVYAERLDKVCQFAVREAKDGDEVKPGQALVAPGGFQMRVQKTPGTVYPIVRCRGEERISGHCPSVDVLFESVASSMGPNSIGIILTGMGSDGAEGLLSMRRKGCQTYGQDEKTSMVYGMPRVAFLKGAVKDQLPLDEIGQALCSHLMSRK